MSFRRTGLGKGLAALERPGSPPLRRELDDGDGLAGVAGSAAGGGTGESLVDEARVLDVGQAESWEVFDVLQIAQSLRPSEQPSAREDERRPSLFGAQTGVNQV